MESTNGNGSPLGTGQFLTCRLDQLRLHPSYVRLGLAVSASSLSALAEQGELAFREPLVITRDRTIVDGYARSELARLQGRATLPCIEYELTEEEALRWLLLRHCRSNGLNGFCRIRLALDLEPCFKEKALLHQRLGGQMKGSSNLTEDARVDVRKKIAAAATASVGNVTKVKQVIETASSEVLEALRGGEISIHRAWKWSTESQERQREEFKFYQSERGIKKTIRTLVSRHQPKILPTVSDLGNLIRQLSALDTSKFGSVRVEVIRAPGQTIFLTEELSQALESQQELHVSCSSNNR